MAGHSCALNSGPYTSFTESSSFDLFGSPYSYDHMSFSSGSGYAYVWLYLRTPTTSTTLGISYGGKGFAAILPTIAPKTDSFYAGRLYVSAVYFTIQPTVRFALDPMTSHRATQYSGSANLEVKEGVETTLAYSQRVISFFLPWDLNLSGKVQGHFRERLVDRHVEQLFHRGARELQLPGRRRQPEPAGNTRRRAVLLGQLDQDPHVGAHGELVNLVSSLNAGWGGPGRSAEAQSLRRFFFNSRRKL
jgi:hypothetical protein